MTQNCPRCGSARIKRGYRPTKWWSAIVGRYYLLCDSCNWEFIGFALPGTVKGTSRKRVKTSAENGKCSPVQHSDETGEVVENQDLSKTIVSTENVDFETAANGNSHPIESVFESANADTNRQQTKSHNRKRRRGRVKTRK